MIAHLHGFLFSRGPGWVIVDVHGVGYKVICAAGSFGAVEDGSAVQVLIHQASNDHGTVLYGFLTQEAMVAFRALTSVQGLGPTHAMSLLGKLGVHGIASAVHAQDRAALTSAPGVGGTIAARVLLDMREHAAFRCVPVPQVISGGTCDAAMLDAAHASLYKLGFSKAETHAAVQRALKSGCATGKLEDVVLAALMQMAPSP